MVNKINCAIQILKLTGFSNNDDSYTEGRLESLRFCYRKHLEGWTIDMFKEDLNKFKTENKCIGDYMLGIISGLKYNIKLMEEI